MFAGEHLTQLQEAWRRTQRPIKEAWEQEVAEEWGDAQRNTLEQNGESDVVRKSNPNFCDIPTNELFAKLADQVAADPAPGSAERYPDAVLLDLVSKPHLVLTSSSPHPLIPTYIV